MEEDYPMKDVYLEKFTIVEKNFFNDLSQRVVESNEFACKIVNTNGYLQCAEEYLLKRQKIYLDVLQIGLEREESMLFHILKNKLDVLFTFDLINFEELQRIYKHALIDCGLI